MNKSLKILALIAFYMSLLNCQSTGKQENNLALQDSKLPFLGKYTWSFEVPDEGPQLSSFTFSSDSILYSMKGPAFTTEYTQMVVSYDVAEMRSITVGKGGSNNKDGIYFVMFFKDITDSTLTIYKHESDAGLQGALKFKYPANDAEEDHGWNVYKKVSLDDSGQ